MSEETNEALERYLRTLESGTQITAALHILMEQSTCKEDVADYVKANITEPRQEHIEMLIVVINDLIRDCKLDRGEFAKKMEHMNGLFCNSFAKVMGLGLWEEAVSSFLRHPASVRVTIPENNSHNTESSTQP